MWWFILGTAGLLGWAGLRRVLEMREGKALPFGVPAAGSVTPGSAARSGFGMSGLARRVTGSAGGDATARGAYSPLGNPDAEGHTGRGPG